MNDPMHKIYTQANKRVDFLSKELDVPPPPRIPSLNIVEEAHKRQGQMMQHLRPDPERLRKVAEVLLDMHHRGYKQIFPRTTALRQPKPHTYQGHPEIPDNYPTHTNLCWYMAVNCSLIQTPLHTYPNHYTGKPYADYCYQSIGDVSNYIFKTSHNNDIHLGEWLTYTPHNRSLWPSGDPFHMFLESNRMWIAFNVSKAEFEKSSYKIIAEHFLLLADRIETSH